MNLHEYQAKQLLKQAGVPVPAGQVAFTAAEAYTVAQQLVADTGATTFAVKAQIHAGGRGKGGGVKIVSSPEAVKEAAAQILGMHLVTPQTSAQGKLVSKVYVEQGIYDSGKSEVIEFYVSILLNRKTSRHMVLYSPRGGMNIEQVADETPDQLFRFDIDVKQGLTQEQSLKIASDLKLNGKSAILMQEFVQALWQAYNACDATLVEINPVVKTSDDIIYAADAKVVIDNNSLFRHPDILEMRDLEEENPAEIEAAKYKLNYIKLDGNVGCMVNGAGLAMATMDIIKMSGGSPANFQDVGGGTDAEKVEQGFRIILRDPNVKAILVNIFGGIVRCDRVANGIVAAYKNIGEIPVPLIVRLQGTNAAEAKQIIDDSGLKVNSVIELNDAAELVNHYLTLINSTSNTNVANGGIALP